MKPRYEKTIAARSARNVVILWDSMTGLPKGEIRLGDQAEGERWECFAFSPEGNRLAIGGVDAKKGGFVDLWRWE